MHSVLLPYRDRPEHLSLCLNALLRTSLPTPAYEYDEPLEVILLDQASKTDTQAIIEPCIERLNIQHFRIDDDGPFHKTKLLNFGLQNAVNDVITVLDVDCMVCTQFFNAINKHFQRHEQPLPNIPPGTSLEQQDKLWDEFDAAEAKADKEWHQKKLGHRMMLMDPEYPYSQAVIDKTDWNDFRKQLEAAWPWIAPIGIDIIAESIATDSGVKIIAFKQQVRAR